MKFGHLEQVLEIVNRWAGEKIKNHLVRLDISRARKSLATALEAFVEVKNELITEYSVGDTGVTPDVPGFDEFVIKYNELLNDEAEGFSIQPLKTATLDMFEISVDEMDLLIHVGLLLDMDAEVPGPAIGLVEEAPTPIEA